VPKRCKAQWISKSRCQALRRAGLPRDVLLLDTFAGFIVVEPTGRTLGDGPLLSTEDCDYELSPAWYAGPIARQRLGLRADFTRGP
jgi:hypothetical protein